MQCGIMRVEKRGRAATYGLQIEANRTVEDHEGERDFDASDIDWERTAQNEHLVKTEKWSQAISARLRDEGLKARKDSIVGLDALYTASPDFFSGKSHDEIMRYFRDCLNFHINEYCQGDRSRVLNAVVHLDEQTPHLQIYSIPLHKDDDGKMHLSAKIVMGGRQDYQRRQNAFFESVTKKYGLERGELRDAKSRKTHVSKRDWQIAEQQKKLDEIDAALKSVENVRTEKAADAAVRKEKGNVITGKSIVYEVPETSWAIVKHAAKLAGRAIDAQQAAEARAAEREKEVKEKADEDVRDARKERRAAEKNEAELRKRFAFLLSAPKWAKVDVEAKMAVEDLRQDVCTYQHNLQRDCVRMFLTKHRGGENARVAFASTLKEMSASMELVGVNGKKEQTAYLKMCLSEAAKQMHDEYHVKGGEVKGRKKDVQARQDSGGGSSGGWEIPHNATDYLHSSDGIAGAGGCPRLDGGNEHEGPWSMLSEMAKAEIEMKELFKD